MSPVLTYSILKTTHRPSHAHSFDIAKPRAHICKHGSQYLSQVI